MTQPAGDIEELKAQFVAAMQSIRDGVQDVVDTFNALVAQVRKWAWTLGAGVLWWIRDKLEQVRDHIGQLIDKVKYALEHETPVLSLFVSSFEWLSTVMTPLSDISAKTTTKASVNLSNWSGPAASAYTERAIGQKTAVDEAVSKAKFVSEWLLAIATSNVEFAVSLAKIVTNVAGKLVAALADAEAVVTIPWAVEQLSDGLANLVTDGLNLLLAMANRFMETAGNTRDMLAQVGDHSKFPDGKWPEAVRG